VPDFLRGLLARLFGSSDDDPMGAVSADQLAILLKSIEEKYTALQDENTRLLARLEGRRDDREELLERIAAQQREIASLQQALAERTEAETAAELRALDAEAVEPLSAADTTPFSEGAAHAEHPIEEATGV
jgi:peptidoglycan hydrolase CwlO-like protein